ncbi:MAG: helix-turn-helix domain-containing protein, partial [Lentimicrobiaceae bacterium]|nr:helix-turn-helix domain-containing protein [Lentimicrobiaceae bacterium]
MKLKLSQKQIGQRIMELRKNKGLSQEDLAKSIEMSRPSLAQIELGNRNIDVFELFRLSQVLEFSLDEFLSPDFKTDKVLQHEQPKVEEKSDLRISVPNLNVNKFKNVLLYILERCAGKPNIG